MFLMITTIIAMLILGWFVWTALQRQEKSDETFQRKLDADDERARQGREAYRRGSAPQNHSKD